MQNAEPQREDIPTRGIRGICEVEKFSFSPQINSGARLPIRLYENSWFMTRKRV